MHQCKKAQEIRQVIVYGIGEVVSKGSIFALYPLLAKMLPIQEFAVVALILPVIQIAPSILALGLPISILRSYFDHPETRSGLLGSSLALMVLVTAPVIILLVICFELSFFGKYQIAKYELRELYFPALVSSIGLAIILIQAQVLQAQKAATGFVLLNSGSRFCMLCAVITGAFVFERFDAQHVLKLVSATTFSFTLLGFYLLRTAIIGNFSVSSWKNWLGVGGPVVLGALGGLTIQTAGKFTLNHVATASDLAAFGLMFALAQALSLVLASVSRVYAPGVFERISAHKDWAAYLSRTSGLVCILLFVGAVGVQTVSPTILTMINKPELTGGMFVLPILLMSFTVQGSYIVCVDILYYRGMTRTVTVINICAAAVVLCLSILLAPIAGIYGVAASHLVGSLLQSTLIALSVQKVENHVLPWRVWLTWWFLSATALSMLALTVSNTFTLAVCAVIAMVHFLRLNRASVN